MSASMRVQIWRGVRMVLEDPRPPHVHVRIASWEEERPRVYCNDCGKDL